MKRQERKALIKRLIDRYEFLQYYDKVEEGIKKNGKVVFKIEAKYLSDDEQFQLNALKSFIDENWMLSEKEIIDIIKANKRRFSFLLFCIKKYKNFIPTFKQRGGLIYLKSKIAGDRRMQELYKMSIFDMV